MGRDEIRQPAAQDGLRRYNLSRALGLVHREGPISRSEISSRTGLNRSTVATLVAQLTARALVEEVPPPADGARSPGRPSPLVRAHPHGVTVLSCDVRVDSLACAVVGLGGHLYALERMQRSRERTGVGDTLADLAAMARRMTDRVGKGRLTAVGIGVSGVVRPDGIVELAPNLGWRDVPLAPMVRSALEVDVPVHVANEADLGAVAEHARGGGVGVDDFVYVSSEVGIGAGIIVDGRLLRGADGYAGEVGHLPVNPSGLVCGCGARGCWETEVGEAAMLRAAGLAVDGGSEAVAAVFRGAGEGDPRMLAALEEVGAWLGLGFVTLVNLFNPRRIVLGGVLARAYPFVAATVQEVLHRRCRLPAGDAVELVASPLGDRVVLLGAAEMALGDVLTDPGGVAPFDPSPATALPDPIG